MQGNRNQMNNTDVWEPIPGFIRGAGRPQPRIADGVWRAIRAAGDGYEGILEREILDRIREACDRADCGDRYALRWPFGLLRAAAEEIRRLRVINSATIRDDAPGKSAAVPVAPPVVIVGLAGGVTVGGSF